MYLFCLLRFIQMNEDLEELSTQSRARHSPSNLGYSDRSRSDVNWLSSSNPVWMIHRLWALSEDLKWHAVKFLIQQVSGQMYVVINGRKVFPVKNNRKNSSFNSTSFLSAIFPPILAVHQYPSDHWQLFLDSRHDSFICKQWSIDFVDHDQKRNNAVRSRFSANGRWWQAAVLVFKRRSLIKMIVFLSLNLLNSWFFELFTVWCCRPSTSNRQIYSKTTLAS